MYIVRSALEKIKVTFCCLAQMSGDFVVLSSVQSSVQHVIFLSATYVLILPSAALCHERPCAVLIVCNVIETCLYWSGVYYYAVRTVWCPCVVLQCSHSESPVRHLLSGCSTSVACFMPPSIFRMYWSGIVNGLWDLRIASFHLLSWLVVLAVGNLISS